MFKIIAIPNKLLILVREEIRKSHIKLDFDGLKVICTINDI